MEHNLCLADNSLAMFIFAWSKQMKSLNSTNPKFHSEAFSMEYTSRMYVLCYIQ